MAAPVKETGEYVVVLGDVVTLGDVVALVDEL